MGEEEFGEESEGVSQPLIFDSPTPVLPPVLILFLDKNAKIDVP